MTTLNYADSSRGPKEDPKEEDPKEEVVELNLIELFRVGDTESVITKLKKANNQKITKEQHTSYIHDIQTKLRLETPGEILSGPIAETSIKTIREKLGAAMDELYHIEGEGDVAYDTFTCTLTEDYVFSKLTHIARKILEISENDCVDRYLSEYIYILGAETLYIYTGGYSKSNIKYFYKCREEVFGEIDEIVKHIRNLLSLLSSFL